MPRLQVLLGGSGIAVFLVAVIIGFWGFPTLINHKIADGKVLRKESMIRQMWSNFTEPLDFRAFIFNLTNPEDVAQGKKPIVQEVGPFFYDEYKVKVNIKDRQSDDTVAFQFKTSWFFNQEKSKHYTGEELVTVPHVLLMAMVYSLERTKPGMLSLVNKAIPAVFKQPTHPFITVRARDLLFDGVEIDCRVKDFSGKALCTGLKKEGKDLKRLEENLLAFSVFGHKNASVDPNQIRVLRGMKKPSDVGIVVEVNGKPKQTVWSGDDCNNYQGTDSTIFPPFQTGTPVVAFSPDLCRSLGAVYQREDEYNGIKGKRYVADFGDMSTNPKEKCFCPTPDTCLKKGAMDLFPCQGAPFIATLPHCYLCHEDYTRSVDGINPKQEDHEIFMIFEPMTATPLVARKRLQFNVWMHPVEKIEIFKNLPEAMYPLFWVEEGIALDSKFTDQLENELFKTLRMINMLKWILMVLGISLALAGAVLHHKRSADHTASLQVSVAASQAAEAAKKTFGISTVESMSPRH